VADQHVDDVFSSSSDGGKAVPRKDNAGVGGAPAQQDKTNERPKRVAGSFLGLRHWRLRTKLAAVLIIPTLTALALGGLRANDQLQQANQFQQTASQVDFAVKVTAVIHELQAERSLAVARISSGDSSRQPALDAQIAKVDRVVDDLRSSAGQLKTPDAETKARYDLGLQRLDALRPLRSASNTSLYSDFSALTTYSSILDSLVQLGREVNTAVTDRDLLRQGTTVQAVSEAKEFIARGDAALQIVAFRHNFPGPLLEEVRSAQSSGAAAIDSFNANASPDQRQLFSDTFSGPEIDDRQLIRTEALAQVDDGETPTITSSRLTTDSTVAQGKLRAVENNLLTGLRLQADTLANNATTSAWWEAGIVLLAIALALVLMLAIARLMLRPLRILRTTALDVAYTRLPQTVQAILDDPDPVRASRNAVEPVPITSRDEIGEVARSFDVVHEQAVKMAAEQALLRENVNGIFVNLSRRSQRLVERQLGVIDRLEADEQDPDHLASLFELDHLATRLRRNGESLLVLSGAGLAKSVPKPVPAADVIGAAVSEIEQYARIELGIVPEVSVQGLAIHDLVHVLAELLDNATYFSEPETKITVRAVVTRKKALAIQVTDHGVGMSEDQIQEVNKRLADPPDLDVSVTRRMGLYVVARLAQRHNIEVRLRENEDIEGGIIARVVVPAEVLTQLRADTRTPPPHNRNEISMPSMPPINRQPTAHTPPPAHKPPPPPPPQNGGPNSGGLVPLDQPISLDDLVGNNNAAGPFLSPAWPTTEDLTSVNGDGASSSANSAAETQFTPLVLPKREPKYVPVTPDQPPAAQPEAEKSALEDDVPTRRLPIYQSVLSRWFSEEGEAEPEAPVEEPEPIVPDRRDHARQEAPPYSDYERQYERQPYETPQAEPAPEVREEPEVRQEWPAPREPEPVHLPEPKRGWESAADNGWQAAQALLETKDEEITPAGLPKRVPNAYLVPGSVGPSEQDVFADATIGQPGKGAIARSATAARSRMASFQRGYTSGRHAMKEQSSEHRSDEHGVSVSGGGMGSLSEDSSEERQ
jgi:signal transduction histidine kinase